MDAEGAVFDLIDVYSTLSILVEILNAGPSDRIGIWVLPEGDSERSIGRSHREHIRQINARRANKQREGPNDEKHEKQLLLINETRYARKNHADEGENKVLSKNVGEFCLFRMELPPIHQNPTDGCAKHAC